MKNDRQKKTYCQHRFCVKRVKCKLGALCFYSSSVLAENLVLRNPPERKAPKRCVQTTSTIANSRKNRKFDKTNEMTSSTQDTSYADYYFGVLKNLNADSKLDLISQLSQSLKSDKIDTTSLESLFGAYKSEETADEIIAELRSSRVSNRNIEPL